MNTVPFGPDIYAENEKGFRLFRFLHNYGCPFIYKYQKVGLGKGLTPYPALRCLSLLEVVVFYTSPPALFNRILPAVFSQLHAK